MMNSTHIFLTGFMGSGKSMIGRGLAQNYKTSFVDIDNVIVEMERMSIKEIFSRNGEAYFRKLETAAIERVSIKRQRSIIALGGGAFCSEWNIKVIQMSGISVFLDVSLDLLIERLMRNAKRPLLLDENGQMKSEDEIRKLISEMMNKRRNWYEKADICVSINQPMEKEEATNLVAEHLKYYLS